MELNLLTKLQEKISTYRRRHETTLADLENGTSAQGRTLHSQQRDSSSNSGTDRMVVTKVKRSYQAAETPEQILARLFTDSGWVVRRHFNDPNFRVPGLKSKTVAFSLRDDNNKLQKYSGVLEPFSEAGTALFRLAGEETVFNANLVGFMAVKSV
jgi:hypothetical protein